MVVGLYLNIIKIPLHSAACFDGVLVIDDSLRVANGLASTFLPSMSVDHLKQKDFLLFPFFFPEEKISKYRVNFM